MQSPFLIGNLLPHMTVYQVELLASNVDPMRTSDVVEFSLISDFIEPLTILSESHRVLSRTIFEAAPPNDLQCLEFRSKVALYLKLLFKKKTLIICRNAFILAFWSTTLNQNFVFLWETFTKSTFSIGISFEVQV